MLNTIVIVIGISECDRVESSFTFRMPQTVDQSVGLRSALGKMPQRIHHAAVLVMEELQHRTIPISDLDLIVKLFLHAVHWRCILIEIACDDD